MTQLED